LQRNDLLLRKSLDTLLMTNRYISRLVNMIKKGKKRESELSEYVLDLIRLDERADRELPFEIGGQYNIASLMSYIDEIIFTKFNIGRKVKARFYSSKDETDNEKPF